MNRRLCLARRPAGKLTTTDLVLIDEPVPVPGPGEVLVRNTWLSIDPSIRIRLAETTPDGYLPPLRPGDALSGLALGVVAETRNPDYAVGDLVSHTLGYREFAVVGTGAQTLGGYGAPTRVDPGDLPPQWFLGPLGSAGLTAYVGLVEILELSAADTLWVSSAAGAVGAVAAQLAALRGVTVLGSAGSPDKVAYLRDELGIAAFDYHEPTLAESLAALAPTGIDAYFDNVGGDHLTAALDALRPQGRVALCGAVSGYDGAAPAGPPNLFTMVAKGLRMRGFRAGSFNYLEQPMRVEVGGHLAAGRLVHRESIFDGIEQAAAALVAMLAGATTGKTLCRLA
ncbi:MDR family NADP-dependent oxidoreductase [Nocardia jinanensis]|uniref:NADP-dependent oxidoreductase n=1 Tax=Nocardia jinanensis TaxID=382504 RepID=A0A917R5Y2_9NOCA|nr:NADP-dependent oxidoreductase [Nocardia jinanensis]GGK90882.1 NADP-dependent oxidoreductase [Nocardia jinanensis]